MNWKTRLKAYWDEDPLRVIMVGSTVVVTTVAVVNAVSQAQSRRAYAKQVDYRVNRPYDR